MESEQCGTVNDGTDTYICVNVSHLFKMLVEVSFSSAAVYGMHMPQAVPIVVRCCACVCNEYAIPATVVLIAYQYDITCKMSLGKVPVYTL